MKRTQEWLLFSIQLVIKMGFLGRYKLVPVTVEEKDNRKGLKILEKTILSLGKKNDELVKKNDVLVKKNDVLGKKNDVLGKKNDELVKKNDELKESLRMSGNYYSQEISDLAEKVIELSKDAVSSEQRLEFMDTRNTQSENKLSTMTIERGNLEKEINTLSETVKDAEILSEQLKVEMKKWRT